MKLVRKIKCEMCGKLFPKDPNLVQNICDACWGDGPTAPLCRPGKYFEK